MAFPTLRNRQEGQGCAECMAVQIRTRGSIKANASCRLAIATIKDSVSDTFDFPSKHGPRPCQKSSQQLSFRPGQPPTDPFFLMPVQISNPNIQSYLRQPPTPLPHSFYVQSTAPVTRSQRTGRRSRYTFSSQPVLCLVIPTPPYLTPGRQGGLGPLSTIPFKRGHVTLTNI